MPDYAARRISANGTMLSFAFHNGHSASESISYGFSEPVDPISPPSEPSLRTVSQPVRSLPQVETLAEDGSGGGAGYCPPVQRTYLPSSSTDNHRCGALEHGSIVGRIFFFRVPTLLAGRRGDHETARFHPGGAAARPVPRRGCPVCSKADILVSGEPGTGKARQGALRLPLRGEGRFYPASGKRTRSLAAGSLAVRYGVCLPVRFPGRGLSTYPPTQKNGCAWIEGPRAPQGRGRYSLLGPDFHRQSRRDVEAERLRGLEVDHNLVIGRRLHRQVFGPDPRGFRNERLPEGRDAPHIGLIHKRGSRLRYVRQNLAVDLRLPAEMFKHSPLVHLCRPFGDRQPVERGIEVELVACRQRQPRPPIRQRSDGEPGVERPEVPAQVRGIDMPVRAQLPHGRRIAKNDEREFPFRLPFGHALVGDAGRENAASHGTYTAPQDLTVYRVGQTPPEWCGRRVGYRPHMNNRIPHHSRRRRHLDALHALEPGLGPRNDVAEHDQRHHGDAHQHRARASGRPTCQFAPQDAADEAHRDDQRRREDETDCPLQGEPK